MVYSVFEEGVDFEPSDEMYALKYLSGYELHDGYGVWRIGATYARCLKPTFYYVISTHRAAALNKFLHIAPWLNVVKSITLVSNSDAEVVLSNPSRFIVW